MIKKNMKGIKNWDEKDDQRLIRRVRWVGWILDGGILNWWPLYSNKYAKRLWLQSVIVYNADLSPNWFVNMISKKQWSRCLAVWWGYNYTIVIQTYGKHPAVGDWAANVGYRFFVSWKPSIPWGQGAVRCGLPPWFQNPHKLQCVGSCGFVRELPHVHRQPPRSTIHTTTYNAQRTRT